jgi:hypothetical protein
VLVAELSPDGKLVPVPIDRAALAQSGRPVIAVVRIDGTLTGWDSTNLSELVLGLIAPNSMFSGLEIDHDCGTARLLTYSQFLSTLRRRVDPSLSLSITALPAWLDSPDLEAVLKAADQAVLQVHAVAAPMTGLFDPEQARRWIDAFVHRTDKNFRVALPTYGSRLVFGRSGDIFAVESEVPMRAGADGGAELFATPEQVERLLTSLRHDPPAHFAGISWFRLPTDLDKRGWSFTTWRHVLEGKLLDGSIEARAEPADTAGTQALVLLNPGDTDAPLPGTIELPPSCPLADGINGYRLEHHSDGVILHRLARGLLHGGHRRVIGWMRCADAAPSPEMLHAVP